MAEAGNTRAEGLTDRQSDALAELFDAFGPRPTGRYLPSEFPRQMAQTELTPVVTEEELKVAERSLYKWWWEFLRESQEYPPTGKKKNPRIAKLYSVFGDLGDDFKAWWAAKGRYAFCEPAGSSIGVLYDSAWDGPDIDPDDDRLTTMPEVLVVLVYKDRNQKHIVDDFRIALQKHHPGKELKEDYFKKAEIALFQKSRRDTKAFPRMLKAWRLAQKSQKPNWTWIGRQLTGGKASEAKNLNKMAHDYYERAKKMIGFAARGEFPKEEDKPADRGR